MSHNPISRPRAIAILIAVALSVLVVSAALAAHPKAGKTYTGSIPKMVFNGFKAPVSFKVSSTGKKLLRFKYASGDCGGMGGPGDPWTNPMFQRKVGTIKVNSKGNFSIKNAKWSVAVPGTSPAVTKVIYSTVNGRFKTAKKATGTIKMQVKMVQAGSTNSCPVSKLSFTATTK